ncbi:MAG: hypothetical protein A3K10_16630 [Bacteroidetes bacterium RIFCSPLOWO2_12_FULL_31_6]|nr:MAG: hypothetical protein A3K10_16630 [Bacteroidetes bacterium RIFCSPLOWO2_12_FULL_31_6]
MCMMLKANDFKKISLINKIKHLYRDGTYISGRFYLRNVVLLFYYNGYFVEVSKTLEFGHVFAIDITPNRQVKDAYLDTIDLEELRQQL